MAAYIFDENDIVITIELGKDEATIEPVVRSSLRAANAFFFYKRKMHS